MRRMHTTDFDNLTQMMGSMAHDHAAIRQRIEFLEKILERAWVLPGTNHRIGLDGLIGLIPIIGDVITTAMSVYLMFEARKLNISKWAMFKMGCNVAIDTVIGAIPLVGDAFDLAFRSNTRNLRIIKRHLDEYHPSSAILDGKVNRPSKS